LCKDAILDSEGGNLLTKAASQRGGERREEDGSVSLKRTSRDSEERDKGGP